MQDLNKYFSSVSLESKFECNLGNSGGFINFKNSGQRGGFKEFTISLETVLKGLEDIVNNIEHFKNHSKYIEGEWRNLGSKYFTDLVLKSMITVQTKPCFTTFSKIISWANNLDPTEYNDNIIDLRIESLNNAIVKIQELSSNFTPNYPMKFIPNTTNIFLSKPFLLLAGISGTGKTRFVREQAKATGSISETYRLIPVRPDWHEPSDILGYTSRLSGFSEYVTTEVLQFIAKAWRAIIDVNGLKLEAISTDSGGSKLIVKGGEEQLDSIPPYWLCLDEMNLAPVEQYFADYLSILETREWSWDGDAFDYSCDALLSATVINQVSKPEVLRKDLGFADKQYDYEWDLFRQYGMSIPFNLIVAGTVNMDETTHGFSRKVIDRALSFDFGQFFPNDFDQFFSPTVRNKVLSYPIHSHATIDNLLDIDIDKNGSKSIAFLNAINTVLGHTPFELAYRALNELLLTVITSQPTTEIELQAVWDDFLMCKVLPRIEGDQDKLMVIDEAIQDISSDSLLIQLAKVLETQLDAIWDKSLTKAKTRPDLFRENIAGDKILHISCRSQAKIAWMQTRLVRSSFASFWP